MPNRLTIKKKHRVDLRCNGLKTNDIRLKYWLVEMHLRWKYIYFFGHVFSSTASYLPCLLATSSVASSQQKVPLSHFYFKAHHWHGRTGVHHAHHSGRQCCTSSNDHKGDIWSELMRFQSKNYIFRSSPFFCRIWSLKEIISTDSTFGSDLLQLISWTWSSHWATFCWLNGAQKKSTDFWYRETKTIKVFQFTEIRELFSKTMLQHSRF